MMRRKINSIRSIRSTPTERHRTCSLAEGRKCIDSGRCTRETVFNRMQIRASSSVGWTVHGTTGIGVGASFTEQPAFTITSHTRPFTIVRSLSLSLSLSVCLSLSLSVSLSLSPFPSFYPSSRPTPPLYFQLWRILRLSRFVSVSLHLSLTTTSVTWIPLVLLPLDGVPRCLIVGRIGTKQRRNKHPVEILCL